MILGYNQFQCAKLIKYFKKYEGYWFFHYIKRCVRIWKIFKSLVRKKKTSEIVSWKRAKHLDLVQKKYWVLWKAFELK